MQAQFLPGTNGKLLSVYFPPSAAVFHKANLLFLPAFAEEMNRSRWLVAHAARRFSEIGFGVLLLDLYGTGDSAGDHLDARWEAWLEDVSCAATWLRSRDEKPIWLWGLRLGATLAAQASTSIGGFDRLILWQPVVSGARYMDQFLRIAIGEEITKAHGGAHSVAEIRDRLASDRSVEVAGYALHQALVRKIDALELSAETIPQSTSVSWLDVQPGDSGSIRQDAQNVLDAWQSNGTRLSSDSVQAPPFWLLPEPEPANAIVAATMRRLEG